MNNVFVANTILNQVSTFAVLILVALALIAFLQTMILQGKKRIVGGIVTAAIVAMAIGATIHEPTIARTPDHEFIDFSKQVDGSNKVPLKPKSTQESGIKKYCELMNAFTNEKNGIEKNIAGLLESKATTEIDAETLANKALNIKERANKFYGRLQRAYQPQETQEIHKSFVEAAEHLRLAAFALHAEYSSDDKAFRDLQSEQQKEQLKLAQDKWNQVLETLSKLAPEFFNNQQKVN